MTGSRSSLLTVLVLPAATGLFLLARSLTADTSLADLAGPGTVTEDFGEVRQYETLRLVAAVENPTDEPVTIALARPDCGCAPVEEDYTGRTVAPGETLEVAATYPADAAGPFSRAIRVDLATADGQQVSRQWRFNGTVLRQISVTPDVIHSESTAQSPKAAIELAFGGRLAIKDVQLHPPGNYTAAWNEESPRRAVLEIRPTGEDPGAYMGTAFVRLSSPREETLSVPVQIGVPLKTEPTLATSEQQTRGD